MMRPRGLGVALTVLLLAVPAAGETELRLTPDAYPVVDGSTSTQPLGVLLAGRVTGTTVEWRRPSMLDRTRRLVLTGAPYDPARRLTLDFTEPRAVGQDLATALSAVGRLAERTRH